MRSPWKRTSSANCSLHWLHVVQSVLFLRGSCTQLTCDNERKQIQQVTRTQRDGLLYDKLAITQTTFTVWRSWMFSCRGGTLLSSPCIKNMSGLLEPIRSDSGGSQDDAKRPTFTSACETADWSKAEWDRQALWCCPGGVNSNPWPAEELITIMVLCTHQSNWWDLQTQQQHYNKVRQVVNKSSIQPD